MPIELFDARMLAPLVGFLRQSGIRPQPLLDRAQIREELVEAGGWIGKKQAYDFTFDVVKKTGYAEAVFASYLSFEFEHLGPIATAMKACATVKESLEVGLRLGSTAYEGNEYFLWIDGETTWICYREPRVISAGQPYINDMTLTVYFQLVCALVDGAWRPEQALFRKELTDRHSALEQFEECRASCHPDLTALAVPTEFLSRPLAQRFLASEVPCGNEWRFGPENSEPIVEKLHRLLASNFPCRKLPTLHQVAKMVDVSEATLKRRLASTGMSYRRLLDRLRFMEARKLLSVPEMSVRDIALEIGYADTSNFVRSFRRMTGIPPEAYRRQQLLDAPHR